MPVAYLGGVRVFGNQRITMYKVITPKTVLTKMKKLELPGNMTIFSQDFDHNAVLPDKYTFVCTVMYMVGAIIEVRRLCEDQFNKHHFVKLPGQVKFFSYRFPCGVELPDDYQFVFSMKYKADGAIQDANNVYIDGINDYHFVAVK